MVAGKNSCRSNGVDTYGDGYYEVDEEFVCLRKLVSSLKNNSRRFSLRWKLSCGNV